MVHISFFLGLLGRLMAGSVPQLLVYLTHSKEKHINKGSLMVLINYLSH